MKLELRYFEEHKTNEHHYHSNYSRSNNVSLSVSFMFISSLSLEAQTYIDSRVDVKIKLIPSGSLIKFS